MWPTRLWEVAGAAIAMIALSAAAPPISELRARAEKGDASAMESLGELSLLQQKNDEALRWFQRAAGGGRVEAMLRLHDVYSFNLRETTGAKDQARHWIDAAKLALQRDADSGDVVAQMHLAYVCELGDDGGRAVYWYGRAAAKKSADAMYAIGFHYKVGWGVAADPQVAVRWFMSAAKEGEAQAMFALADAYARGDGVARDDATSSTWTARAESTERAKADAGNHQAMGDIAARDLKAPSPTPEKIGEAVRYLERAANDGDYPAAVALATGYTLGRGVPRDNGQAEHWRSVAAGIGLPLDPSPWPTYY
jgi:hypothetical protein